MVAVLGLTEMIPATDLLINSVNRALLYHEIDSPSPGIFTHSILFSDGQQILLTFTAFNFCVAPDPSPELVQEAGNGPFLSESPPKLEEVPT